MSVRSLANSQDISQPMYWQRTTTSATTMYRFSEFGCHWQPLRLVASLWVPACSEPSLPTAAAATEDINTRFVFGMLLHEEV